MKSKPKKETRLKEVGLLAFCICALLGAFYYLWNRFDLVEVPFTWKNEIAVGAFALLFLAIGIFAPRKKEGSRVGAKKVFGAILWALFVLSLIVGLTYFAWTYFEVIELVFSWRIEVLIGVVALFFLASAILLTVRTKDAASEKAPEEDECTEEAEETAEIECAEAVEEPTEAEFTEAVEEPIEAEFTEAVEEPIEAEFAEAAEEEPAYVSPIRKKANGLRRAGKVTGWIGAILFVIVCAVYAVACFYHKIEVPFLGGHEFDKIEAAGICAGFLLFLLIDVVLSAIALRAFRRAFAEEASVAETRAREEAEKLAAEEARLAEEAKAKEEAERAAEEAARAAAAAAVIGAATVTAQAKEATEKAEAESLCADAKKNPVKEKLVEIWNNPKLDKVRKLCNDTAAKVKDRIPEETAEKVKKVAKVLKENSSAILAAAATAAALISANKESEKRKHKKNRQRFYKWLG